MSKFEQLHTALVREDLAGFTTLMQTETFSPDEINAAIGFQLPLVIAADVKDREVAYAMCTVLLNKGAIASRAQENTCTALQMAANYGDLPLCRLLISKGAHPLGGVDDPNSWALYASMQYPECFQFLMDEALKRVPPGCTKKQVIAVALQRSCFAGNLHAVQALLEAYKADPNVLPGPIAGEHADLPALQAITACDDAEPHVCERITKLLLSHGADVDRAVHNNTSVLANAISRPNVGATKALLDHGVSLETAKDSNVTALARAACANSEEIVRMLLKKGADPNEFDPEVETSLSPLACAIMYGRSCVAPLLEAGAQQNARMHTGGTAIHYAVYFHDADLLHLLLKHGGDPNSTDEEGRTPLDAAAKFWGFRVFALLMDFGADCRKANPKAGENLKVAEWYKEDDMPDELKSGEPAYFDVLDVYTKCMLKGVLWPNWTPQLHKHFPKVVRKAVVATLLCAKRKECPLSTLPREILRIVIGYVATNSLERVWRKCGSIPEERNMSNEFLDLVVLRNAESVVTPATQQCLDAKICTKKKFGKNLVVQPMYHCRTCGISTQSFASFSVKKLPSICQTCAEECHKGHEIVLASFGFSFCFCANSRVCKQCTLLDWLLEDRKAVDAEGENGFLICMKDFLPSDDGSIWPVRAGEALQVKRSNMANNIFVGDWHGYETAFPTTEEFIRWAEDFVVMLCDHEAPPQDVQSGEARELSYKKGDLIAALGPLQGVRAEGKIAPIFGLPCVARNGPDGWFEGCHAERLVTYDEAFNQIKCSLADEQKLFSRAILDDNTLVDALPHAAAFLSAFGSLLKVKTPVFGVSAPAVAQEVLEVIEYAEGACLVSLGLFACRALYVALTEQDQAPPEYVLAYILERWIDFAFQAMAEKELQEAARIVLQLTQRQPSFDNLSFFAQFALVLVQKRWLDVAKFVPEIRPITLEDFDGSSLRLRINRLYLHASRKIAPFQEIIPLASPALDCTRTLMVQAQQPSYRFGRSSWLMEELSLFMFMALDVANIKEQNVEELRATAVALAADCAVTSVNVCGRRWHVFPAVQGVRLGAFADIVLVLIQRGQYQVAAGVIRLAWLCMAGWKNGAKLAGMGLFDIKPPCTVRYIPLSSLDKMEATVVHQVQVNDTNIPAYTSAEHGPTIALVENAKGVAVMVSLTAGVAPLLIESYRGILELMLQEKWTPEGENALLPNVHDVRHVIRVFVDAVVTERKAREKVLRNVNQQVENERDELLKAAAPEIVLDKKRAHSSQGGVATAVKVGVAALVVAGIAGAAYYYFFKGSNSNKE